MTASQNSPQQQKVQSETITAKSYITTLLQRLVSEYSLLGVALPSEPNSLLTSTLLQVIPEEQALLLDDLFPQPEISTGTLLRLTAELSGTRLTFTSPVESVQTENGLRTLRLKLPQSLEYEHARDEHRIGLTVLAIPVGIKLEEGGVLKGQLHDVSTQGISISFAKVAGLKRGKTYRCIIDHSDDEVVEIEIEPTRVEKGTGAMPLKLGARLVNMSRQDSIYWRHFTAELERRLLRMKS